MRGADGRVSGRLMLRSGSHAESKFVIELVAPNAGGDGGGIGGNLDAGGLHAFFVDRMLDCRLQFAFDGPVASIAQTGGCGLPFGESAGGRYRRIAP